MAVTRLQLRTRILQRTNHEHDTDDEGTVSVAECNGLIEKSRLELFALLVKAGLQSVPESLTTIIANGDTSYPLPDDYFAIQDVYRIDGNVKYRLTRHDARVRPNTVITGVASTYRVSGTGADAIIEFYPLPPNGSYPVHYIAIPAAMDDDADTVDGVLGWEEYIVVDVSIDIYEKDGLDTRPLLARKEALLRRIQEESAIRDLHEGIYVQDVRAVSADSMGLRDMYGMLPGGFRGSWPWWGGV